MCVRAAAHVGRPITCAVCRDSTPGAPTLNVAAMVAGMYLGREWGGDSKEEG